MRDSRSQENTEKTYLLVTVMAMFARQYDPMLAMACVEVEEDILITSRSAFRLNFRVRNASNLAT